jgi:hypothetical protein
MGLQLPGLRGTGARARRAAWPSWGDTLFLFLKPIPTQWPRRVPAPAGLRNSAHPERQSFQFCKMPLLKEVDGVGVVDSCSSNDLAFPCQVLNSAQTDAHAALSSSSSPCAWARSEPCRRARAAGGAFPKALTQLRCLSNPAATLGAAFCRPQLFARGPAGVELTLVQPAAG